MMIKKTAYIIFLCFASLFLLPFSSFAETCEGDWCPYIGFYFPPETEAIIVDGFYIFDSGSITGHFLGNFPTSRQIRIWFLRGVVGNSGEMGSAIYVNGSVFDHTSAFNWTVSNPVQGEYWTVAWCDYGQQYAFKDYFTGATSTPPNSSYGTIPFRWGEEIFSNNVNFTQPIGDLATSSPFLVSWSGDYSIASSSIYWTDIEIEISYFSPLTGTSSATSSVNTWGIAFQNAQNKGLGVFDVWGYAAINGYYKYRARLTWTVYDYTAAVSEWFYNSGEYWEFSVGNVIVPSAGDYDFTTADFGWLGNMFRDVIVFLFFPDGKNVQLFLNLKDEISTKIPFSYFTEIQEIFSGVEIGEATSTISVDLSFIGAPPNVPLISFEYVSAFITPLRILFNVICWVFLAFYFIRRIPTIL